jgi:hypothetical protein
VSNKFIPKVYQPVDDSGDTWEWVEMTPPATGSVLGMVFISDLGVNEDLSEPNIFNTAEGADTNTTVSPVGVRNAIQSMALSKKLRMDPMFLEHPEFSFQMVKS